MERMRKRKQDTYPELAKLAAFILQENLDSFVKHHLAKCIKDEVLSLNHPSASRSPEAQETFYRSCENLLEGFQSDSGVKLIENALDDLFEYHLGSPGKRQLTPDDIVTISRIRAESMRACLGEYTRDVRLALSIVNELDRFTAKYNAMAFRKYSKMLTANLEVHNAAFQKVNEKLRQFAYEVSHELKTPLRRTSACLDLVREKVSEGKTDVVSTYLKKAESATTQMGELIDKLLAFATLDNHQPEKHHCDLNAVLEEVVETLEPVIKEKNATIIPGNLPSIKAASFQMRQLFQNLLANSLKFCKNDVPPVVEISNTLALRDGKSYLIIEVTDNCIGFDNQYSATLFSAFTRLHRQYDGTGLGLSICKRIVENHGGTISAKSEEGVGTKFLIELPMG